MDKVIFDTNAYRYLVSKTKTKAKHLDRLVNKLRAREKQNGIQALISPVVAKELLYHAANQRDYSYFKCMKAASAMYKHCLSEDGKEYRMMASVELLLSNSFYGLILPRKIETNKAIGQILFHLSKNPTTYTLNKLQRNLSLNRAHVKESEGEFVGSLKGLMQSLDPTAEWQPHKNNPVERAKLLAQIRSSETSIMIAMGYLSIVAELLIESGQLSRQEAYQGLPDKAAQFVEWFPAPLALYREVLERMAQNEYNLTEESRANFLWDIHLMFNVGAHQIGDGSVYFVTDDKAMTEAARVAKAALRVFTFKEYMELMGLQADLKQ